MIKFWVQENLYKQTVRGIICTWENKLLKTFSHSSSFCIIHKYTSQRHWMHHRGVSCQHQTLPRPGYTLEKIDHLPACFPAATIHELDP